MFSKRTGWIGVDVGTHTVKLAQIVRGPMGLRLRNAVVIQRCSPWPGEDPAGAILPRSSQGEIHAGRKYGDFSGRSSACVLPMSICELHGLNVPPGSDHERHTMIAGELNDDWVERPDPVEFDFWELNFRHEPERSARFNINVLAVPQPWIVQIAADFRQAKLDCWSIDGVPLAIARAVGMFDRPAYGKCSLAIDWGFSNATACIVCDSRALYARRLRDCGLRVVLEAICQSLDVSLDEAQFMIDGQGLATGQPDDSSDVQVQHAITEAVSNVLETLTGEVRRTLQFIQLQRSHLMPEKVWLMGGGATIRNIDTYLAEALKLPVRIWDIPVEETEREVSLGKRTAIFSTAAALSLLAWGGA